MANIVEGSPANSSSIKTGVVKIFEVVDGLSPADHLVTRQRHMLYIFRRFSRFDLLSPAAFTLALLDVPVLDQSAFIVLVKDFVP